MRIRWIAVVLLFVGGCASELTQPLPVYQPPDTASPQAQQKDVLECAALARQIMLGRSDYFGVQEVRVRGQCLESRGWQAQAAPARPAPIRSERPAPPLPLSSAALADMATRRCEQQALSALGRYQGPQDGREAPAWGQALSAYRQTKGIESWSPWRERLLHEAIAADLQAGGHGNAWGQCLQEAVRQPQERR
jgi:hypothetical protein